MVDNAELGNQTEGVKRVEEARAAHRNWLRRLRRVLNDMPPEIWIFVAGCHHVMVARSNGYHAMAKTEGVHPDYVVESIQCDCDGGDW